MRNLSRGTRALVLLAFAATAALTGPGAAGAQGPLPAGDVGLPVLAEQLRFRAELGLPADAALVRDLNASWADGRLPGAHTEGAVFTAEEARELDAREEAGREIAVAARAYFPAEAPTHLAGIHIDHASGNTVVSVTRDAGRHLAALRARTRHGDRIAMRVVRFGLVDLERAARTVVDRLAGGDVWTGVGVSEFDNRVDVDLLADTPANRARVLAVLSADDAPMVRFFQGAPPSFSGTSERNAPPIKGGQKIQAYDPQTGMVFSCTSAFDAYRRTRTDSNITVTENFSVTAGHCERDAATGRGSTGDAWSEYKLAPLGYAMGSSTRNSWVNEGSDGLRIPIKSTDASQRVAITSTNDRIIIVRQGSGEDVLNERICMSGAVTGGEVCGVLLSRTHTITHGGMTFRNQRVASYPNQQGDSGGSILYGSTGKGVNSGMLTYAGAWRSFYSQIQIVLAQLDLTNLTGIS